MIALVVSAVLAPAVEAKVPVPEEDACSIEYHLFDVDLEIECTGDHCAYREFLGVRYGCEAWSADSSN